MEIQPGLMLSPGQQSTLYSIQNVMDSLIGSLNTLQYALLYDPTPVQYANYSSLANPISIELDTLGKQVAAIYENLEDDQADIMADLFFNYLSLLSISKTDTAYYNS